MARQVDLRDIERRIQIVEDNLRQLQEQAAAYSRGACHAQAAPAQDFRVVETGIGSALVRSVLAEMITIQRNLNGPNPVGVRWASRRDKEIIHDKS